MSNWRAQRLQTRDDTSAWRGPDGEQATPRLSPALHPQHHHHSSSVLRRSLCLVRIISFCMLLRFEPLKEVEVALRATGVDGHQHPSKEVGTQARGRYTYHFRHRSFHSQERLRKCAICQTQSHELTLIHTASKSPELKWPLLRSAERSQTCSAKLPPTIAAQS